MPNPPPSNSTPDLQFDRATPAADVVPGDQAPATPTPSAAERPPFRRAVGLGLLGSIAGAILYNRILVITGLEIGIVAIACGFIVGWAVRRGADGYGGRRYQVLAIILTYFSIGLAYGQIGAMGYLKGERAAAADSVRALSQTDSARQAAEDSARAAVVADSILTDSLINAANGDVSTATPAASAVPVAKPDPVSTEARSKLTPLGVIRGSIALLLFVWTFPIFVIVGGMPQGLFTALFLAIGMRQAWRMTG